MLLPNKSVPSWACCAINLAFDAFERNLGLELAGKETWSLDFDFQERKKKCFVDHWSKISSAGKLDHLKVKKTLLFHLNIVPTMHHCRVSIYSPSLLHHTMYINRKLVTAPTRFDVCWHHLQRAAVELWDLRETLPLQSFDVFRRIYGWRSILKTVSVDTE